MKQIMVAELTTTHAGSSLKLSTGKFIFGRPCHLGKRSAKVTNNSNIAIKIKNYLIHRKAFYNVLLNG
jgi:hypothetical protein